MSPKSGSEPRNALWGQKNVEMASSVVDLNHRFARDSRREYIMSAPRWLADAAMHRRERCLKCPWADYLNPFPISACLHCHQISA